MSNNSFSGEIPSSLFNASPLIEINMRFNMLSGKLPDDICSNGRKLEALFLTGNQLSGEIPANVYKCRELQDLRLPINSFSVACNRIHKKLDKYDEFLPSKTTPVISYHEQPSWHVASDVVQPRPPPDPPNRQPWI
ncbi:hypothetical protein SASPL_148336 [Salvia splendens]|uniref:LRR receptor-like serine/threonine-protein kinase FLS2 n=1 Tax=Salvia splendens TaxID=180675 RepID=A0A8X8Z405_SALSN|nr:hypothetical protein SASPL_148336 [Salvia splendens]